MKQIQELLQQPMSRQQFLRVFVAVLLSVFGIGNLISYLLQNRTEIRPTSQATRMPSSHGFGSRTFGN